MIALVETLTAEERAYITGLYDPLVDKDALAVLIQSLCASVERKAGLEVVE